MLGISGVAGAQTRASASSSAKASVKPKLSVVASTNATALAQALAGAGVTISNATLRGAPLATGTFSGAAGGIGIDAGIVLSTGNIASLVGPNKSELTSTNFALAGDPQLDAIAAPQFTRDAAVLEFDVTTTQPTIGVRYVFASEDYNGFVGSIYNDVLAIFVNGVNCANVGGRPVSVNTINADLNPTLFVDNTGKTRDTEMNGMTTPLDCVSAVTPNVANRVKIAIADTVDGSMDSAIFLAAGGVSAPGMGSATATYVSKAVEFHHPGFNHYFLTVGPGEIALLDNGTFEGWFRTGVEINLFNLGAPDSVAVCRFFSTAFGARSSHFYTPNGPECVLVKANPDWQYEGDAFSVMLPAAGGVCPAGTQALSRLYNQGENGAPGHRYALDAQIRDLMTANGWAFEGVFACVPN
ncbi:MAG: choice-of-anchor L domain-containing protein [Betaproteobacteria bacterium]